MVAPAMKPIAASSTDVPACRETTGRSPRSPRLLRAGALTAGLAALALGAGCTRLPMQAPPPRRPSPLVTPPSPPAPKAGGAVFAATAIDDLENQDGVHFFARRKEGALLVFSKGGRFFARAVGLDGAPRAPQATDIGAAPTGALELLLGLLTPVGDGYVLAWAERESGRTRIATLALDASGAPRGTRSNLTEIAEEVWALDVLPRETGALVAWETWSQQTQRGDVLAAPLSLQGAPSGPPVSLVSGVLAWYTAPSADAIAVVMPIAGKDDGDPGTVVTGKVSVVPIDAAGKPKLPIEISASPTAQPDVVASEIGGRIVLAWTDMRELDAAVWTAVLDKSGTIVVPARRATPPTGEQALVGLAGGKATSGPVPRGLLAWEDVLRTPTDDREIHLATIGPDGALGKERATMAFRAKGDDDESDPNADSNGAPPEPTLSADASGFGAITLAPAWTEAERPAKPKVLPTFVRFGADLTVLSAEPIRADLFGADAVPYSVNPLSFACKDGACSAVCNSAEAPSHVGLVALAPRKSEWSSPARRDPDDAPPRAASLTALHNGDQIARVAATELSGGGSLTAWATYFPEGDPSARAKKNGGAEVSFMIAAPGTTSANAAPISLSKKAVSVGGVALASSQGDKKEIAIAWVAREKGESQVYVTKVDETGKKTGQKKLTVIPRLKANVGAAGRGSAPSAPNPNKGVAVSEASDVAIAWSGADSVEGWIVSWVDTRDGNAEVYAAKLDRDLNKIGPDRRITDAPGDAAEVQLLVRGKETFLAWSDARQKVDDGRGDIYVTRIDTRSLMKVGVEARLAATPMHSRSPQIVPGPSGSVWASWIEEPGEGADAGGSVRFAVLDDKGSPTMTSRVAGDEKHVLVSAALACGDKGCHVVVGRSAGDALLVEALELSAAAQPGASKTLLTLPGVGTTDISPVFSDKTGASLFFAADAASGLGRVRRLKIDW